MGKVSPNNIVSLLEDWGLDENTNLPFGGQAIQNFIKSYLQNVTAAAYFDPQNYTMYFFGSEDDMQTYKDDPSQTQLIKFAVPMNFSSTLYRVKITNNTGSTVINTATNAGTCPLSTTFMIQTKSLTDVEWTDTQVGAYVTIEIDKGVTGQFVPLTQRTLYAAGSTIELDVFNDLELGASRVRFRFEAEDDSVTSSLTYTINLAELYVELFSNTWYQPILQSNNSSWYLGGFRVAGAGYKTLHFDFYDNEGTLLQQIQSAIGTTNAYVNTPYYYRFDQTSTIFGLTTGTYKIRVYVTTDTLSSEWIEYSIMYVASEDTNTAKLVVANEIVDEVFNYSTSTICEYGAYNGGATLCDLDVTFTKRNGSTIVNTTTSSLSGVETGKSHKLEYLAEWEVMGDGYFIGFDIALNESHASAVIPLNNTFIFPPTAGYDFYLNAATRYNSDVNKNKILNGADDTLLNATWNNIDFLDGVDGWTVDDEGRKCLFIPAGCSLSLPYSEFSFFNKDNITIELAYKVANVADSEENIITIASNPTSAGFTGLRIRPNNITVHSANDVTADNDSARGTRMCDSELTHFVLTVNPNFEGNHKIVKGFLNGCKNFEFAYANGSDWLVNADLTIAPQQSDVYLYFVRRYPTALADQMVQNNYINSLYTVDDRKLISALLQSVVDQGQTNVDYESVKNSGYNFFVITMQDGASIPSAANGWGKKTTGKSILEMHYGQHPDWDWKIGPLETAGQGTTSMNYYRWNIRFRIDKTDSTKKVPVQYLESRTRVGDSYQYTWKNPTSSKTVIFDGDGNHPALKRITAKINAASSMQSHKMGSTKAYNDLERAIGLTNEAQDSAISNNKPVPTTAVYQYPAFGFEYDPMYGTYTFCGLFTIGPDKGDKPTFGFDTTEDGLISLEGTDHSQPLAKFSYPWNNDVKYIASEEGLTIVKGSGDYLTGLEVSNCFGLSTDKASDQTAIENKLIQEFKPAYDAVWENSTLIFPIALGTYGATASDTLSWINSHLEQFRGTKYNNRLSYSDMQFWIEGEYKLYYYDEVLGRYAAGQTLTNPSTGTLEQQNNNFKARRRTAFKECAESFWDVQDALYHFDFLLIFGATDNFAKNSYPYKMKPLANGGRWKWRQDDLDTIFDIDNAGGDTKPYYIEYEDADGETLSMAGAPYFSGSNSIFWNLIFECYWEDYISSITSANTRGLRTMGGDILAKMRDLSGASNVYDGFVNYIKQTYWDKAQNYFPQSAYNIDANFKYELAWINNGQAVDPLSQALGNHKSAEELWVRNRAVYMASLFRTGAFGDYSDHSLGTIAFRPANVTTLNLSPSMWLYPAMISGQASPTTGERTSPGNSTQISVVSSGGTTLEIQGSNYLNSVGDFKNVVLDAGYMAPVSVEAAKITQFKIGDANAGSITTNIFELQFPNNKCLEVIDGRNVHSLTGVDVSNCSRLRELYLNGSNVSTVSIPRGSKITNLSLPATIQSINFRDLKHLENANLSIAGYSNIRTILIEHTLADGITITKQALNNSQSLNAVRLIWDGLHTDTDGTTFAALATLTNGNYHGLSPDGEIVDKPVIEGTIYVPGTVYTNQLIQINESCPNVNVTADTVIFSFEDSVVGNICITNWGSGGQLTLEQGQAVTNLSNKFQSNTNITSFRELQFFTGLTSLNGDVFSGCTNLSTLRLPSTVTTLNARVFKNCTSLRELNLDNVESVNAESFDHCGLVKLNLPKLNQMSGWGIFGYMPNLIEVESLGEITTLDTDNVGNGLFRECPNLEKVTLPEGLTVISTSCFRDCPKLKYINFPTSITYIAGTAFQYDAELIGDINLPNLQTLGSSVFIQTKITSINVGLVTTIDTYCFRGCSELTTVSGSHITTFKSNCFNNCTSLTNIDVSHGETFEGSCFYNCTSLELNAENLSNAVTIGGNAFSGVAITGVLNMPNLTTMDGSAIFKGKDITRIDSLGHLSHIYGMSYEAYHHVGMFESCTSLTSVVLPSNLEYIGRSTFGGCTNLATVTANGVGVIGASAFSDCTSLTQFNFSGVTKLESSAFNNAGLTGELSIPALNTNLGDKVFYGTKITSVTNLGTITTLGPTRGDWQAIGTFQNCTSLTTAVIPDTCTTIGTKAFSGCTSLSDVTMNNVTTIWAEAFYKADLSTPHIDFSPLISVGQDAFSQSNLTLDTLSMPNLASLGQGSFYKTKIKKVTNLGLITTVPQSAFEYCSELTEITLNQYITTIGFCAFNNCPKLTKVVFLGTTVPTMNYSISPGPLLTLQVPAAAVGAWCTCYNTTVPFDRGHVSQYLVPLTRKIVPASGEVFNAVIDNCVFNTDNYWGYWGGTSSIAFTGYCVTFPIEITIGHNYEFYCGFTSVPANNCGRVAFLTASKDGNSSIAPGNGVTKQISDVNIKYVVLSMKSSELANCYIKDLTTDTYVWRGSDVTTHY